MGQAGKAHLSHATPAKMIFFLKVAERGHIFNLTCENASFLFELILFLIKQIQQWEQNLEKFHMDLFRMRCYLASLQGGELPNPKSLLAAASRPSKLALGRLGILSVSSFHALVSFQRRRFGGMQGALRKLTFLQRVDTRFCCDLTQ